MIYTYVATGLIAGALAATCAWKVQEWRHDAIDKERVEQALVDQRLQATKAIRREEQVIAAQNQGQALARRLRLDGDAARTAADGLRNDLVRTRADAATSIDACLKRADTLGELLVTVEEAGRGMAQAADLHANSVQTLMTAWPRE